MGVSFLGPRFKMSATQSVQTFGKKKTATAVALAKEGKGLIKVNGVPLSLYGSPILRGKLYEPVLLLQSFTSSTTSLASPLSRMDIRLRVSGGGHTSQLYALRQAIGKAVVAYVAKYEDAASARAEEVRRKGCACPFPEVLPLNRLSVLSV